MDVTVRCISYEFAQWQGERAAQDRKIDTPTDETLVRRCRRLTLTDYVFSGRTINIW